MTYRVEQTDEVDAVAAMLPPTAAAAYLELRAALELAPWNSAPVNPDEPRTANSRTAAFDDGQGIAVFVIIEHEGDPERRVVIVKLLWAG